VFKLVSLRTLGFKRLELEEPLMFPDGRVLIYGRNESGKSTVMEAIHYALYGYPLYPTKKASNEDVIRYGRNEVLVELAFTIDQNQYIVRRIIKTKGANTHELRIQRPESGLERIMGARRVNEAIIENLHGLDSEALLNSCLVEQKELGKLESGNKNERIKAMTNLLNIEAFVEARDDIKGEQRDLERENYSTKERLAEAESAKTAYEDAEKRKIDAESRVDSIKSELDQSEARIQELDKILSSLEIARNLANKSETKRIEIKGIDDAIQRIKASLEEARNASLRAEKLEAQLPVVRNRAEQAQKKTEDLDRLLRLESQLRETRQKQVGVKNRIGDASEKAEEAQKAKEKVEELVPRITDYDPANSANTLLPTLDSFDRRITNLKADVERAREAEQAAEKHLSALKGSEEKLGELEKSSSELNRSKAKAAQTRIIGIVMAITGVVIAVAAIIIPIIAVIGVPLVLAGAVLFLRNSTSKFDSGISSLQVERNALLGDQQRIGDYTESFEKAQASEKVGLDELGKSERELSEKLSTLPTRPRDYASVVKSDGDFSALRSQVTEDLQMLTRLKTEMEKANEISAELDERLVALETLKEESSGYELGLDSIQEKINKYNESGVEALKEKQIKEERDEANENLTRIIEEIRGKRETASKIQNIEAELKQSQEANQTATAELTNLEAERERTLAESGADPKDEEELEREDEELMKRCSSLETEQEIMTKQIDESFETMENNKQLREEHPLLESRYTTEKFELDAMTRAIKLLDITRDSIMSGVKKSVEAHMAQFLPTLTENRYNMARIDEEEYQIEAYDREAKTWRRKGVFSGGTQDQFSLALRLAFALSTIPETRGARPGFIFLDEPLSSFDSQRREGFINLLKNELSQSFPQIIVISHIEQLQEEFPNLIQLDSGRVI